MTPDSRWVTVHPAEAPHNLNNHGADNPNDLLTTFAVSMAIPGCNNINVMGDVLLVLGPEHAEIIASAGWSKNDVRSYLYELARQPLSLLKLGRHPRSAYAPQYPFGPAGSTGTTTPPWCRWCAGPRTSI